MSRVVIIGSGLGGLECGYILARHGYDVTVLEQCRQIGGCLQSFSRRGSDGVPRLFDCGFHYVGGLDEGQSLHPLFRYFGLLDLPWRKMDEGCFDEVVFVGEEGTRSYPHASGHENFAARLSEAFPGQRSGIGKFTTFLKGVGDNIYAPLLGKIPPDAEEGMNALFSRSAHEFLKDCAGDGLLAKVLSGSSLKMELGERLPLYVFAQINNSFIQSAWRLEGGGRMIAEKLAEGIRGMGGEVCTGSRVTAIKTGEGVATGVETSRGEFIPADWIISDAHPALTAGLVEECRQFRRIYRRRMGSLENSFGMFTANIILKPGALPYLNRNIHVHREGADLWNPNPELTESVMIHYYPTAGRHATHLDLISPMSWSKVEKWADLPVGRRGEQYEAVKAAKLAECLELASRVVPGLPDAVDKVWCSTPLSYQSYLSSPQGSAYGALKDWNNPSGTILSPRTPLPNLLLTGQSLNLHGILGVSMTSVLTCACVLGSFEAVTREIF